MDDFILIDTILQVASLWQNKHYRLRQQAVRHASSEYALSPLGFSVILDWIFALWNKKNLQSILNANPYSSIQNTLQIVASNTPAVMAQAFLHGLLLRVPQIFKLPTSIHSFPFLLLQSLQDVSPQIAKLFWMDHWQGRLHELYHEFKKVDLIIVYGEDKTIEEVKSEILPHTQLIAEGHAVSAAIIFKSAIHALTFENLAWDMLSYDQRGCLSPRVTFVEVGGALTPDECAAYFAEQVLPKMVKELPGGSLNDEETMLLMQKRAEYGFEGSIFIGEDWTVCYNEKKIWPKESLPRFMPFKPFENIKELKQILRPVNKHLISIGYAGGHQTDLAFISSNLRHLSKLGKMQKHLMIPGMKTLFGK